MDTLSAPNHTQTPNVLFDVWLPQLKESELKILLVIIRQTLGWHKKKDKISLTLLEKKTGLGRSTIAGVLHSEKFTKIVEINRSGNTNEYSLKVGSSESALVQNLNQGSSKSEPITSSESEHTKETIKETKQKKERTRNGFYENLFQVNGCPVPENLQKEGVIKAYKLYLKYMQENYSRWPTSTTTEMDLHKLSKLAEEGNDPEKVIEQTIQGRNKSFFRLRDKKFTNQTKTMPYHQEA
jgi:hypothetical protein